MPCRRCSPGCSGAGTISSRSPPASHARVVARPERAQAESLTDVLGWSLPFAPGVLPAEVERDLAAAGAIEDAAGGLRRCGLRVSRVGAALYIHSAFPTHAADAVFLGPDSYRFADAIAAELTREALPADAAILDIGTGAGVGAVTAGLLSGAVRVVATDINADALRLAAINAAAAGLTIKPVLCDSVCEVAGAFDLVLTNPPFIVDAGNRAYRDGGGSHGAELPLRLARDGLTRLAPGGRLLVYTGSAIVGGVDGFRAALGEAVAAAGCTMDYREIDPDVFGEELSSEAYAAVDRIALVCAVIRRPGAA